jgi:fimbrial chaperone protein
MVIHFAPKGKGATQVLTLENPGGDKTPVQIQAFARDEKSGEEKRGPTSEFTIYPEQVVLLPNEKRNVRVTFSGDVGSEEKSYRFVVSQLPVDFKDKNAKSKKTAANVNFLLEYVASAYVTPENAAAKIKVKEVKVVSPQKIAVTIENEGGAHQVLHLKSVKISEKGQLVEELGDKSALEGVNFLAKTQKKINLSLTKPLKGTEATVELQLAESAD